MPKWPKLSKVAIFIRIQRLHKDYMGSLTVLRPRGLPGPPGPRPSLAPHPPRYPKCPLNTLVTVVGRWGPCPRVPPAGVVHTLPSPGYGVPTGSHVSFDRGAKRVASPEPH